MQKDTAKTIYRRMVSIRVFEERVEQLFAAGELPGFVHLYIGEEACAVGVCSALNDTDYITSTHRGHGHCIAKGGRLDRMMAELFAKGAGYNKGKGGSMHIAATDIGILGANGIVGGGVPIALGAALSSKMLGNGRVAVAFFGDGASNQGSIHESMNMAAAFNLPIVFVCENNQFGVGTPLCAISRNPDIFKRAAGYGMPGRAVDGMSVLAVHNAASEYIDRARAGEGPALLEVKTWRYRAHFQGEPASYRTSEQEREWLDKDPIPIAKRELQAFGLSEQDQAEIEQDVKIELEDAVLFARNSPSPDISQALTEIYA
jgi:pyruvate dehydrogenase E1 component alpha subunit